MTKVEEAINKFRSNSERDRLFLQAQAEIRLSEKMIALRLDAGLTQKELADRLNVSQAFIAKMEAGGYDKCGIGTLRGIALALGCDISFHAMFVRHQKDAVMEESPTQIILHTASHTLVNGNVIDFDRYREERVAAVG